MLVREMPASERPVQRLWDSGVVAMSTAELLQVVLSDPEMEIGMRLLVKYEGLRGIDRASVWSLIEVEGLGEAKAARLKAALELGKRSILSSYRVKQQMRSPGDAAQFFMTRLGNLDHERLLVMLLDVKNFVKGVHTLYVGTVNANWVRVGEIFRLAVECQAAAIVVAHNHPSGDPMPSPEDVHLTTKLVGAGNLLDIEVLDHIIVGNGRFVSMKERGLGFS